MRRIALLVPVILFMLIGIPAYAYGDPTGGALFQMLMPALAFAWGAWLIFARKLRVGMSNVVKKLSGKSQQEESSTSSAPNDGI